jgi:hypothetical protein
MTSLHEASKARLGPATDVPAVAENAARLREILDQLDAMTVTMGQMSLGNSIASRYYEIVRRAALVRQRESLEALISLCETGHSAFAVCLLRPAYEELLWVEYLAQHPELANDILIRLVQTGITDSVEAQSNYLGSDKLKQTGFTMKFVKMRLAKGKDVQAALREMGRKLGWRPGATLPSVALLSRKVGREKEYTYLYQATSRFVHFSPHELVRRAWGNPTSITISSAHFTGYWSAFALHWGLRIYIQTFAACSDLADLDAAQPDAYERMLDLLNQYVPPVPIITREELEWPW